MSMEEPNIEDLTPFEDEEGHGDLCTCPDCREVRAGQYREMVRYAEFREEQIALVMARRLKDTLDLLDRLDSVAKSERAA